MSNALAPLDAVLVEFDKLVRESRSVVQSALRAPDIPRDELGNLLPAKPEGWSEREWNVARDAMESSRNAPVYLMEAFRLHETAVKVAAGFGGDAAPKLVQHVVHVVVARPYGRVKVKTIDVEAKVVEEKENG
jgi:hypothetical protein